MSNLKSDFQTQSIEKAKQLRERVGGTIFAFPNQEDNPLSSYAIVMYAGGRYFPYPNATDISMASAGVLILLEELKKVGQDADYERNVRIVSYQAQMDAPSTVMRQLRKSHSKPFFSGDDYKEASEEAEDTISARGVLKLSYIQMTEEKNPKAILFMDEYYKLLATRKYGKTAAAIKQEVRKMTKDQALRWLEKTFEKHVHEDMEIFSIISSLK